MQCATQAIFFRAIFSAWRTYVKQEKALSRQEYEAEQRMKDHIEACRREISGMDGRQLQQQFMHDCVMHSSTNELASKTSIFT